jgi:hypothetical protein
MPHEGWAVNANLNSDGWNVNANRPGNRNRWNADNRFLSRYSPRSLVLMAGVL